MSIRSKISLLPFVAVDSSVVVASPVTLRYSTTQSIMENSRRSYRRQRERARHFYHFSSLSNHKMYTIHRHTIFACTKHAGHLLHTYSFRRRVCIYSTLKAPSRRLNHMNGPFVFSSKFLLRYVHNI